VATGGKILDLLQSRHYSILAGWERPATETRTRLTTSRREKKVRLIKLFGLAAVVAVAATALIGAASASAMSTTVCKTNELPCEPENQYAMTGFAIKAKATNPELTSNLGTIKCASSESVGSVTGLSTLENGLVDLLGEITELTFSECKLGTSKCTVTAQGLPDMVALLQIEGTMNGNLVTNEASAHVSECLNCTFGGEVSLEAVGGEMGNIVAEDILIRESGIFCPEKSKWKAKYLVSEPAGAMWVSN
jgi:hypothetical protein